MFSMVEASAIFDRVSKAAMIRTEAPSTGIAVSGPSVSLIRSANRWAVVKSGFLRVELQGIGRHKGAGYFLAQFERHLEYYRRWAH